MAQQNQGNTPLQQGGQRQRHGEDDSMRQDHPSTRDTQQDRSQEDVRNRGREGGRGGGRDDRPDRNSSRQSER